MTHLFLKKIYAKYLTKRYKATSKSHQAVLSFGESRIVDFEWVIYRLYLIMPFGRKIQQLRAFRNVLSMEYGDIGTFSILIRSSLFLYNYSFIKTLNLSDDYFLIDEQERVLNLIYFLSGYVFNPNSTIQNTQLPLNKNAYRNRYFSSYHDDKMIMKTIEDVYKELRLKYTTKELFNNNPLLVASPFLILKKKGDVLKGVNIKIKESDGGHISIFILKNNNGAYFFKIETSKNDFSSMCNDHLAGNNIFQYTRFMHKMKETSDFSVIINAISMFFINHFNPSYTSSKPYMLRDKYLLDMIDYD